MSAAVARATVGSTVPVTQNTALVLEFRCLFTHDVRRKSKRWQDGFLRYHTFNKRVMVYDDSRNLVGDTHWKEDTSVQEGDELTLEKGVLVQVGEALATSETDITPLFQREKEPLERVAGTPAPRTVGRATGDGQATPVAPSQLRHKSLNELLGTPRRQHGWAVISAKSPYELRHEGMDKKWEDCREPKRLKVAAPSPAPTAVQESTSPKSKATKDTPLWARTADTSSRRMSQPIGSPRCLNSGRETLTVNELINVASNTENISSDITVPSTPPGITGTMRAFQIPLPDKRTNGPTALRPRTPLKTSLTKVHLPAGSPPVSTTNKIKSVAARDAATDPNSAVNPQPPIAHDQVRTPRTSTTKPLRLASSAPRKMLLCQRVGPKANSTYQRIRKANNTFTQSSSEPNDKPVVLDETCAENKASKDEEVGLPPSSLEMMFESALKPVQPPRKRKASTVKGGAKNNKRLERTGVPQEKYLPGKSPVEGRCSAINPAGMSNEMALDHGRMDRQLVAESHLSRSKIRQFTRVQSEASVGIAFANDATEPSMVAARDMTLGRKPLHRSASATTEGGGMGTSWPEVELKEDRDVGPWSTEAFDLFDWRPPDRNKEGKRLASTVRA